jgi:hypothetical protein
VIPFILPTRWWTVAFVANGVTAFVDWAFVAGIFELPYHGTTRLVHHQPGMTFMRGLIVDERGLFRQFVC